LRNPEAVDRGVAPPEDALEPERLSPEFWAAFTLSGAWE
jgi:CHAT domain-containing protein